MSIGQSIRSGAKWLMVGKIGNRFIQFAFGVILARLLMPADFGMIATIAIFTGFVGMFTSGGMGQSLIRAKEATEDDFTAVFTLQLAMGLAAYSAFFFAAPWIAAFFENSLYTDLIRVSALSFLLRPFVVSRNAWLNREMNFKSRSFVDIAAGLITGVASSSMAWAGMGVWSLLLGGLFAAFCQNVFLAYLTPLKLRLNADLSIMRRHSKYGSKIVAIDFVSYLRKQSQAFILSKLAGPAFLGIFNKAESLSRLPNQMLMSPVMEPLFRAMSKTQDDLDQTKYLFFRAITLLMAYTTPVYVLLWWIAEPFITVIYGEKWIAAGAPMSTLTTAGVFLNVIFPCSKLLAAQDRLIKEMVALSVNLFVMIGACLIGLTWGLNGVAWGIVFTQALLSAHLYWLAQQTLKTNLRDLFRAAAPGLSLSIILFCFLAAVDYLTKGPHAASHIQYLLLMTVCGGLFYAAAFLMVPFAGLHDEAMRWRNSIKVGLVSLRKFLPK
jgi:O-antigen/teichoic acid export membrane protein